MARTGAPRRAALERMELVILDGTAERRVSIERIGSAFAVSVDGRRFVVDRAAIGERLRSLVVDGHQFEVSAQSAGDGRYRISALGKETTVEVRDPLRHLAMGSGADEASDGKRAVTAYMPGRVVAVLVEEGHQVEVGQGVVVLEAMKMENEIRAEVAGKVTKLHVRPGQSVEGGDLLFEIGDG
ncbi:MAG TPA: biotin/lipoyl-containing protein [Thermoanaerobaculia bacterium]|nr:biotin/lipoyl-containing protein [Thermoanaerobaculia bacterium]